MGRAKEYMIEMEEAWARGFLAPDKGEKYVCPNHFKNRYLKQYIIDNSQDGICSYCGAKGGVIDLADFIDYVGRRITDFVGPIDKEDLYLADSFIDREEQDEKIPGWCIRGPYLAPDDVEYYDCVEDVLSDFDLYTDNHRLDDDIASCFNVDNWIRRDPTSVLMKDEMMQSWLNFAQLVKTKQRYTFFRSDDYYAGSRFTEGMVTDIIAEVANMVCMLEDSIDVGTRLYRGRPEDNETPFTSFSSMTAPPADKAKDNRMSPFGISMFYGSFDSATPVEEIRNYEEDDKKIFIGEFEVTKQLKVINLCKIPSPNFWMEGEDDWQRYAFLHNFHREISKPIGPKDSNIEYIPSQVFCEYLRYIQKTKDGTQYDGIIYKSAMTGRRNVVLFYDNENSASILKRIDI